MKKIISNISEIAKYLVVGIYLFGLSVAIPYENYQYIKMYGFIEWASGGEFGPTLRAFLWPIKIAYLKYRSMHILNDSERIAAIQAQESFTSYMRASQLFADKNKSKLEASTAALWELNNAKSKIYNIDCLKLKKLHPELPWRIEHEYKPILETSIQLMNSNIQGGHLIPPDGAFDREWSWQTYLKKNVDSIFR